MDYLIFSDSHRHPDRIRLALERQNAKIDGVFFLGDGYEGAMALLETLPCPVYAVKGNCDLGVDELEERLVTVGDHRVLVCHGHLLGAKYGTERLVYRALEKGADVVLFGHTHRAFDWTATTETSSVRLFNPGSIGEGNHTFGVMHVDGDTVLFSHGTLDD